MAEFAASIIGIVSAGTKVALVLSQLSADVGSAGHEARMIGGEIRSFCSVLKTLGETIEQIENSSRYAHCSEMIKDMTEDSLQMFTEILNAVDKLKKMTTGRDGKDGSFGLVERVQWAVLKKPKLLVLRAAIEAYKTNLTLMLGTLSAAERATRRSFATDKAAAIVQDRQDRSLIESLELDREATLIELAQAERCYEETDSSLGVTDAVSPNSPPAYDAVISNVDLENTGLLSSARDEIQAIRSSLPKTETSTQEALEAKITRHSRRISSMLETDKEKLSQRWSQTLQEASTGFSRNTPSESLLDVRFQEQAAVLTSHSMQTDLSTATVSSRHNESKHDPTFNPRDFAHYQSFLSWLTELESSSRRIVLRALKQDIPTLEKRNVSSPVISNATPDIALFVKSTPHVISISKSDISTSTTGIDRQGQLARSDSRKNRKAFALPALKYAQPSKLGSSFLVDQTQRPPGRKPSPARSMTQAKDASRSPSILHSEPLSPASMNTTSSIVSTSRQEALARLVGSDQSTPTSLPTVNSDNSKPSLPQIHISRHRRSRSEHTLNVTKLNVPPTDYSASRSRSVHDLPHKVEGVDTRRTWDPASDDISDDDLGDEGSSMWWKSLGNISPQPFRRRESVSQLMMKH